jgi:uncharacterized protein (TIGR03000 family)
MGGRGGHGCHGGRRGGCCGGYAGGGCYGGRAYGGCTGGGYYGGGCTGGAPMMGMPPAQGRPAEKIPAPKKTTLAPVPATILVSLPAEAKLTVDGAATQSTTATRYFVSPPLTPGQEYFYELKAQVQRDGKTVERSQRVAVEAGKQTRVAFDFAPTTVARR